MTTTTATLADVCEIRTRYRRSVHLEHDARIPNILDGYVLTPLSRKTLARIVTGIVDGGHRAWTLTGPYGSGKSAFQVLLFALLSKQNEKAHLHARQLLKQQEEGLSKRLQSQKSGVADGLVPVLLTGERTRLDDALLRALNRALSAFYQGRSGAPAAVVAKVQSAVRSLEKGKRLPASGIVELIQEAASTVSRSKAAGAGVLVAIDELGKFLEHATLAPSEGDVHLLQQLAEAANHSGDAPIVVVTTLHQAFEQYASRLGTVQRSEWAKIQGRFEDVAFQESSEQLLHLIGEAIDLKTRASWHRTAQADAAKTAASLTTRAIGLGKETLTELLQGTAPLHPSTALVLGPCFRSHAAQNERSLFAFLASNEPHGFQAFLRTTPVTSKESVSYRIPELYEYLSANFGSALEAGSRGRLWAKTEEALGRLDETNKDVDAAILKVVGLLTALGSSCPITASEEFIAFALVGEKGLARAQISEGLVRLQRQSVLVARRYKDAFEIWDGSDVDIEELITAARSRVDASADLAAELQRLHPARPLVAKRHLFTTGTLRYFDVRYMNAAEIANADALVPKAAPDADGLLVYVIPSIVHEGRQLSERVSKSLFWLGTQHVHQRPLIVAIPDEAAPMRDALIELSAIEAVRAGTAALDSDVVARRELAARENAAREHLQQQADAMFGLARKGVAARCAFFVNSEESDDRKERRLSARSLSDLASNLCDTAYALAPEIHNELVNRRNLSSAAAAARRVLIDAMLTKAHLPDLGFEGDPPERAIYRSVLERHKLHRTEGGVGTLSAPRDRKKGFGPAWRAVEDLLAQHDGKRVTIADAYSMLERPPFGMKPGLLPLLLTAVLIDLDDDVALYEDDSFVPRVTPAIMDRLARNPHAFQMQRSRISGARAQVFERLADGFAATAQAKSKNRLVRLVKELAMIINELPAFSLHTRRISARTVAVREALVRAKDPSELVFTALPVACGLESFGSADERSDVVDEYFKALRTALDELQRAYPALLAQCCVLMQSAFGIDVPIGSLRRELRSRSSEVLALAVDAHLKAFLIRATDESADEEEWLFSILTQIAGKPPTQWSDADFDAFQARLALKAETFRTFEALAFSMRGRVGGIDADTAIRLALAKIGGAERSLVVRVGKQSADAVARAEVLLEQALRDAGIAGSSDLAAAALARVLDRFLKAQKPSERQHV